MATRFVRQAEKQVNPLYDKQRQAVESQIPATQQLYSTLSSGLERDAAKETQNILEDAGARGVLRSTLPVDTQTELGVALGEAKGQLSAQQAQAIGDIRGNLSQLGIQRLGAIQSLADSLQQRDLAERNFELQRRQTAAAESQSQAWKNYLFGGDSGTGGNAMTAETALEQPQVGSATQRQGGGFNFTGPQGEAISAAKFAELNNVDIRDVIYEMGQSGDTYAQQVYNQLRQDPFFGKGKPEYDRKVFTTYRPLFWGVDGTKQFFSQPRPQNTTTNPTTNATRNVGITAPSFNYNTRLGGF